MKPLRVLVGCEESGRVRDAFIARGHDALSCDIQPTRRPGPHYQGDVRDLLESGRWDLGIFHPPCTYLCASGLHWNKRRPARAAETEKALDFVRQIMAAPIKMIAIENPVGLISTAIAKPTQIIQPYEFGHDASKATCLWLRGLLPLRPTLHIAPRMVRQSSGRMLPRWGNQGDSGQNNLPSRGRSRIWSETYQGIADAMADQWGGVVGR